MVRKQIIRCCLTLAFLGGTALLEAAAKEAWTEVKSPHFVAYSDAGEAQARKMLREFEAIRNVFLTVFPGLQVDPPKPTILIVTRDENSMKRFLPKAFAGKNPKRDAGVFLTCPDRNYAILRMDANTQADQPFQVLFHEFTHGIIHLNFSSLPTWLDEGIADFYGSTEIRGDYVMIGKVPRGRLETIRNSPFLPLETLVKVTQDSPHYREGDKTGVFYAQSWVFVHYLFMHDPAQKAGLFRNYLAALEANPDPLAAARASFGELDKFLGNLVAYSRQSAFRYWNYNLATTFTDKDFQARNLDAAAALVVRAEFLQNSNQEPESRPLLQEALRLNPLLPEVHSALGQGHFLRKEPEPATAAFEAALRLGSGDFIPHYYLARLAQETRSALPGESSRTLEHLEHARRLRPDFPGIHMLLCREYSLDPAKATLALEEGKLAVQLEPRNLSFRANLGYACLNLDREAEASTIGEQLQKLAREPWEKELADRFFLALSQFSEQKKAQRLQTTASPDRERLAQAAAASQKTVQGQPLKFQLPATLTALGQEVLQLLVGGRTKEAIQKVEAALAKTRSDYDRKALQKLLGQLKENQP